MLEEIGPSIWALVGSWLTPTALFVLLNLVIGTIALSSKAFRSRHRDDPQPKSVIHRLRSIGLHRYASSDVPLDPSTPQHEEFDTPCDEPPPRLSRAPSVLERLLSVGLYRYPSTDVPLELTTAPHVQSSHGEFKHTPRDEPPPRLSRATSVLERLLSVGLYTYPSTDVPLELSTPPHAQSSHDEFKHTPRDEPPPRLSRTPSVLELLRSIGLCRYRSDELPLEPPAAEPEAVEGHAGSHQFGRSQSEPRARAGKEEKREVARVKKSASAKAAVEEEAGEVDARADDFINRFRHQLNLQRLNSIMNLKEMLDRGK